MEETNQTIDSGILKSEEINKIQEKLPNSGGVLTLGILSIVFAGGIGIILGIIGLSISGAPLRAYKANPEKYTLSSYKNLNAGRICSIIGMSIAGLLILIFLMAAVIANI